MGLEIEELAPSLKGCWRAMAGKRCYITPDLSESVLTSLQLHFISRTPEMLTWSPPHYYDNGNLVAGGSHPSKTRPAQPFEWHAKLLRRDGQDSGAFVQMFWGKNFGSGTTERRADCMAIHQPDPSTIESVDVDPNTGEANRWKVDELAHMNHDKSPVCLISFRAPNITTTI